MLMMDGWMDNDENDNDGANDENGNDEETMGRRNG
jgi:hypothetical protein